MYSVYSLVLFGTTQQTSLYGHLQKEFTLHLTDRLDACIAMVRDNAAQALLIILGDQPEDSFLLCERVHEEQGLQEFPVIMLAEEDQLSNKLRAFELGCDDFMPISSPMEEINARLMKAIFNKIANDQLKSRVAQANEMAFSALASTSNLGVNIQFLLDSVHCDNLDQLGQLFFRAIHSYGLHASIQLRSEYGVKNMEENGMAKDLESQLLDELKEVGHFYDFGMRTVINQGQASVLIKNMPIEDQKKCNDIKENLDSLIHGLDARLKAIDTFKKFEQEKILLKKMSQGIQQTMCNVDESFQHVMRQIATVVDDMAECLGRAIPSMGLSEMQEKVIEDVMEKGIMETQKVFNKGLKIDEKFLVFVERMDQILNDKNNQLNGSLLEQISRQ